MASRYAVGTPPWTWDGTAGTKWATSSGGAGGSAVPTASDDVFFDGNSGTGIVTLTSSSAFQSLTCTGYTGELTGAAGATIGAHGTILLVPGMTWSFLGTIAWANAGSCNFTSAAKSMAKAVVSNSAVTLLDALSMTGNITLQSGVASSLDGGGFDITCANFSGGGSGTFTLGAGTLTITDTDYSAASGLTVSAASGTIKFTGSGASTKTFAGGGKTYGTVWNNTTGSGAFVITGSNTITTLTFDDGRTVKYTDGTTQTVTNFNAAGSSLGIVLTGTSTGGWAMSKATGSVYVLKCTISYSTVSGGAEWLSSVAWGNIDGGSNSGWNFNAAVRNHGFIVG